MDWARNHRGTPGFTKLQVKQENVASSMYTFWDWKCGAPTPNSRMAAKPISMTFRR